MPGAPRLFERTRVVGHFVCCSAPISDRRPRFFDRSAARKAALESWARDVINFSREANQFRGGRAALRVAERSARACSVDRPPALYSKLTHYQTILTRLSGIETILKRPLSSSQGRRLRGMVGTPRSSQTRAGDTGQRINDPPYHLNPGPAHDLLSRGGQRETKASQWVAAPGPI